MKLKQITINQYKSVKQPVCIPLDEENKYYTFIGKNGSGKTVVLEAIKAILGRERTYDFGRKATCEAECLFELTDEELETYLKVVDWECNPELKYVKFSFSNNEPEVKFVAAPAVEVSFEAYKQELQSIIKDLKSATKLYLEQLKEIEDAEYRQGVTLDIIDEDGYTSYSYSTEMDIKSLHRELECAVKEIERFFKEIYREEKLRLDAYGSYPEVSGIYPNKFSFYQLRRTEYKLDPLLAKELNCTDEDIQKVNERIRKRIAKINKKLEKNYQQIKDYLSRFSEIQKEILRIYIDGDDRYYQTVTERKKVCESFLELLRKTCYHNIYYIDNEKTILFKEEEWRDSHQDKTKYFNGNNPIVTAFDTFLKEGKHYYGEESILQPSKIEKGRLEKLVRLLNNKFLNEFLPVFDQGEILGFELRFGEKQALDLFVKEKSGELVPFNQTSLGRRWYLTYLFVKQLLKEGDCLFVDEPGAFLHPTAEEEIRNDLIKLSQKGIYVFVSTHSAYMMPDDWKQIYHVTMSENGTQVRSFLEGDENCELIKEELGINATTGLLFHLSKTLLFVEGVADKVCIEKFTELLGYDLSDYHIHICDGHSILQLCYLCHQYKFPYKAVLDEDNKYKGEQFKKSHLMYEECMKVIKDSPEKCIFVGEGKDGSLEDLFDDPKGAFTYFNTNKHIDKIDKDKVKKIKSVESLSKKTLENFEQLFIKLGLSKLDK